MRKLIMASLAMLLTAGVFAANIHTANRRSPNRQNQGSSLRATHELNFDSIALPFLKDSVAFTTANGVQTAGSQRVMCYKFKVESDTAIYVTSGNRSLSWGPNFYISKDKFDSSLSGTSSSFISAYSDAPTKFSLTAGEYYVAFGDDGYYNSDFYVTKIAIDYVDTIPNLPDPQVLNIDIDFKEVTLPYIADTLAYNAENGAVNDGYENLLGFKFTIEKDTTVYIHGYNNTYGWGPNLYYSTEKFKSRGSANSNFVDPGGISLNLEAGTYYMALGDDGFSSDIYYISYLTITYKDTTDLASPTTTAKVDINFKEISLPYVADTIVYNAENGAVNDGYQNLLGFKFTIDKDTTIYIHGCNNSYDWGPYLYYSTEKFNNTSAANSSFVGSGGILLNLEAGTYYMALGDDGFSSDIYYTSYLTITYKDTTDLASPVYEWKGESVEIPYTEISLPYYNSNLEFKESNGAVQLSKDSYIWLKGLKFTIDKDTTVYFQAKNREYEDVTVYVDSVAMNTKSIYSDKSYIKDIQAEADYTTGVSLKAGTYYVVLSSGSYLKDYKTYSYFSTAISISLDGDVEYLPIEDLSKAEVKEEAADSKPEIRKILRDGVIYIIKGDEVYGVNGNRIK